MEITFTKEKMSSKDKRKYLYGAGTGLVLALIASLMIGWSAGLFFSILLIGFIFSIYTYGVGPEQVYYGKTIRGIEKELKTRGWLFLPGSKLPVNVTRVHNVSLRSVETGYVYPAVLRLVKEQGKTVTFVVDAYHGKILVPLDKIEDVTSTS